MAEFDTPIDALRDRLTQLLADWGAEMSMVLKDLEDARGRLAEVEGSAAGDADELEGLRRRVDGQEELIETLKGEAEEAGKLRKAVRASDLEVEKLRSELESKRDLIKVLRKDLEKKDDVKKSLERAETELASQRDGSKQLERRLAEAEKTAAASENNSSKLAELRAELDAQKALTETLRTDAKRCEQLESQLDEKRAMIAKLEVSLESQAGTVAELKESVSHWKEQCAATSSDDPAATTAVSTVRDLPVFDLGDDDDEEADPEAQAATDVLAERTLAINMRDALRDARATQERAKKKRAAES